MENINIINNTRQDFDRWGFSADNTTQYRMPCPYNTAVFRLNLQPQAHRGNLRTYAFSKRQFWVLLGQSAPQVKSLGKVAGVPLPRSMRPFGSWYLWIRLTAATMANINEINHTRTRDPAFAFESWGSLAALFFIIHQQQRAFKMGGKSWKKKTKIVPCAGKHLGRRNTDTH